MAKARRFFKNNTAITMGLKLGFSSLVLVATLLLGTILSISFWYFLRTNQNLLVHQAMEAEVLSIKTAIEAHVHDKVSELKRLRQRWEIQADTPQKRPWVYDTAQYISSDPSFQAIEWADASYHIRWIAPLLGNEAALGLDISRQGKYRAFLDQLKASKKVAITEVRTLVQGSQAFLAYVPVYPNNRFGGFIIGVMPAEILFNTILTRLQFQHPFTIEEDNKIIFSHGKAEEKSHIALRETINLYGKKLMITVYPSVKWFNSKRNSIPEITLVSGLLFTLLLALSIYFSQQAYRRQKELMATNKQLKVEVSERKAAEQAAIAAEMVAEAASRQKSAFVANMSHEIRTPMNGVIGMTSLLLGTPLSSEQREYAETIHTSSESLLNIIDDILDFSKIEAGKLSIEPIPFNLRDSLEEMVDLLNFKARDKKLRLMLRIAPGAPLQLVGDPGRIRQVLVNFTTNGIKFTNHGYVLINVEYKYVSSDQVALYFFVKDTGIGIANHKLEAIFEEFTQEDTSTSRNYGGTGLGLAISKKLAELMGGEVGANSQVAIGSTFWFKITLPVHQPSRIKKTSHKPLLRHRILVLIEDNMVARILVEQLNALGFDSRQLSAKHHPVTRLLEAVNNGNPYQLVMLEKEFAGQSCIDIAQQIQNHPELKQTKLITTTSWPNPGDCKQLTNTNISGYLAQPVKEKDLINVIAKVLRQPPTNKIVTKFTKAESKQNSSNTPGYPQFNIRILLAEDNVINRRVAIRMLEKLGCHIDVATNGNEVIKMWLDMPYDLILMDCQMPELDGLSATRKIRSMEADQGKRTPIIALTANAMAEERQLCLAAGMDEFITKPVKTTVIIKALKKFTNKKATSKLTC
jgi:signal transduction histidine kinase/CheY-like chemotaxis protein/sensor domain CHASE-containing protein